MPLRSGFWAAALVGLITLSAPGDSAPMFGVYRVAVPATHIVIVTEGTVIDGGVEVLESLKGDLRPGQTLQIPWLSGWADPERRKTEIPNQELWETTPELNPYAPHVTGNRILLFLVKRDGGWKPASQSTGVDSLMSVAWVENQEVYAYVRSVDWQPLRLRPTGKTEAVIKREIDRYLLEYEPSPYVVGPRAEPPAPVRGSLARRLGGLLLAAVLTGLGACLIICAVWRRDFSLYRPLALRATAIFGEVPAHIVFTLLGVGLALAGIVTAVGSL